MVILDGICGDTVGLLLQFMYHGAADVGQGAMGEFLEAARSLQVKGLDEMMYSHQEEDTVQHLPHELVNVQVRNYTYSCHASARPLHSHLSI